MTAPKDQVSTPTSMGISVLCSTRSLLKTSGAPGRISVPCMFAPSAHLTKQWSSTFVQDQVPVHNILLLESCGRKVDQFEYHAIV
jgi:hypothetical protein